MDKLIPLDYKILIGLIIDLGAIEDSVCNKKAWNM